MSTVKILHMRYVHRRFSTQFIKGGGVNTKEQIKKTEREEKLPLLGLMRKRMLV